MFTELGGTPKNDALMQCQFVFSQSLVFIMDFLSLPFKCVGLLRV